jgi:hypothetical protein
MGAGRTGTKRWSAVAVALAGALGLAIASACGAPDPTPVVVRGQIVYSAQDGGGPYTFGGLYLRLDNGVVVDDAVVDHAGRFVLRAADVGAVLERRQQLPDAGFVRFALLSDTTWGHEWCGHISLPALRPRTGNGSGSWVDARSGRRLTEVTIVIHINGDDRFHIGDGRPARLPRVGCPAD